VLRPSCSVSTHLNRIQNGNPEQLAEASNTLLLPQISSLSLQLNSQGRAARWPVHRQNRRENKRNPGRVMVLGWCLLKPESSI